MDSARPFDPDLVLIEAPSNLGLKPLRAGHIPGTWRAPEALRQAGLHHLLRPKRVITLPRPPYRDEVQPGTRIRNGLEIRRFSEMLAAHVREVRGAGSFPLVIGGDCSILLGCLHGASPQAGVGLIHIDGHSDFFHPGNYDPALRLGSAAGMDLALATGRGEELLARWNGSPLIEDAHVVQIGEREETDPNYPFHDIAETQIRRIPVRRFLRWGVEASVARALAPVAGEAPALWLHVDLDVLDARALPAVDCPGSPGLDYPHLSALVSSLVASGRIIGADITIFDPDLDPEGAHARKIAGFLAGAFAPGGP